MNTDKSQVQALRRSGDTSLKQALFYNIQQNQNGSLPLISPFLLQRTQPRWETLQTALDLTSSEDFDLDFELDKEFEALERSVVG
jgi:hypothetical protein